jgi:thioredoxin 1
MKTTLMAMLTAGLLVGLLTMATAQTNTPPTDTNAPAVTPAKKSLPKLMDFGANKCVPCKAIAPVLEELKKEYAGQLEVEFIDVWKDKEAGKPYKVEMIPTQIFFDANGKELFRHTGFMAKADILAKWKELGVELKPAKK